MLLRSGSFAQSKQSARLVNKAHSLAPARTCHTAHAALTSRGTSTAPCTDQSASAPRLRSLPPVARPDAFLVGLGAGAAAWSRFAFFLGKPLEHRCHHPRRRDSALGLDVLIRPVRHAPEERLHLALRKSQPLTLGAKCAHCCDQSLPPSSTCLRVGFFMQRACRRSGRSHPRTFWIPELRGRLPKPFRFRRWFR